LFLDDLEFREGDCGLGDNVVFECNFDGKDPLCGFVNDAKQMLNFTRSSGRISAGTGPDADHTVIQIKVYFRKILSRRTFWNIKDFSRIL